MRRFAFLGAAATLLSCLVVLGSPAAPAYACSRVVTDPYAAADFVLEGTVIAIQPLAGAGDRVRVTVAVDRMLKGTPQRSATVGAPRATSPEACAYAFEPGARCRVYGHADERRTDIDGWAGGEWRALVTPIATPDRTAAAAAPRKPADDPHPFGPVLALGVATLATAGLAAAVVIRRRRAQ